jgi:YHS domain-containing protein
MTSNSLPRRAGALRTVLTMRFHLEALLLACALALGACAAPPLAADAPMQPESPNNGPFRTTSQGIDQRVMLEGHDAVAYFTRNAAVPGDPSITYSYRGVLWRFASAENKAEFERSPQKYMPQFGGFCSNGINYAVPWGGGGGPDTWRIYRGKLYVFGGQKARDQFEMDTELNLKRAHHYWNVVVSGSNAVVTRIQHLVFRVPHYKSDAALQAEWEALRAAGKLPVMPGQPQVVPASP